MITIIFILKYIWISTSVLNLNKNWTIAYVGDNNYFLPWKIECTIIVFEDLSSSNINSFKKYIDSNISRIMKENLKFTFEIRLSKDNCIDLFDIIKTLNVCYLWVDITKSLPVTSELNELLITVIKKFSSNSKFVFALNKDKEYHNFRKIDSSKLEVIQRITNGDLPIKDANDLFTDENLIRFNDFLSDNIKF